MRKAEPDIQDLANNKRAYHDYEIQETFEAGIALSGSEVKSCRKHSINFTDAYAEIRAGEAYLKNVNIAPYKFALNNESPIRTRKLLLHKAQILRIAGKLSQKGLTLIPLKMYLSGSRIKVQVGLARGKRQYEKRDDIKKREAQGEIDRAMTRSVKQLYK
jgi:SsrA-binding protein